MRQHSLPSLLQMSRWAIERTAERCLDQQSSCVFLDATCGNGHDTLYLASTASSCLEKDPSLSVRLLAFDIQPEAIANTTQRLGARSFSPRLAIEYFLLGHEHAASQVHSGQALALAVYNLGFLPGSDKTVITRAAGSMASLTSLMPCMMTGGVFVIHAYGGHEGGLEELTAVRRWAEELAPKDWLARCYETITPAKNPECLLLIEKIS